MLSLVKAQTNGNDFIIISDVKLNIEQIKYICDRHYGIGCDQLIIFKQIHSNIFNLEFYNNDGSSANMCGNGSCAFALFVNKYINNKLSEIYINVMNTQYKVQIISNHASIIFPMPYYMEDKTTICTGNYHRVYSINQMSNILEIQNKYSKCNIHFIEENKYNNLVKMITFERGAGRTLACGSGAVAVSFYLNKSLKIVHDGGISKVLIINNGVQLITQPKIVCNINISI